MTDDQLKKLIYALARLQKWGHDDALRLAAAALATDHTTGDGRMPSHFPEDR